MSLLKINLVLSNVSLHDVVVGISNNYMTEVQRLLFIEEGEPFWGKLHPKFKIKGGHG